MLTVDLFAGCGGLSKGLDAAGLTLTAAYDKWEPALIAHSANMDHAVYRTEIVIARANHIADQGIECLVGGPPCQGYSSANLQDDESVKISRNLLTLTFARIAVKIPTVELVMWENVPTSRRSDEYQAAVHTLEEAGFYTMSRLLDAKNYGVPQRRTRLFTFASRSMRQLTVISSALDAQWSEPITIREYLGDEWDFDHFWLPAVSRHGRSVYSLDEMAPTVTTKNHRLYATYSGHIDNSAPPGVAQVLTPQQMGRLQTFPRSWYWPPDLNKIDMEKMIGNAVPVNLAHSIGRAMLESK